VACGPSPAPPAPTSVAGAPSDTVWLCRPGQPVDPCTQSPATTVVAASGAVSSPPLTAVRPSSYDCFYVYPTVSHQAATNSDLQVEDQESAVARNQASLFSSVCNLWAPMYRQLTLAGLVGGLAGDQGGEQVALRSLLRGWHDYLAHHNGGRPIVLIGHSQGAALLIRLLHDEFDADPALRHRLVSAIVVGGNVEVAPGRRVGGSFTNLPLCSSPGQVGCVIAYSAFGSPPAADAIFGRPGRGVSVLSGQTDPAGREVACTNPAELAGGTAPLVPYFPAAGLVAPAVAESNPWVSFPDLYSATCRRVGGATWLQVSALRRGGDARPVVGASLGPRWGYHGDDINLALGNLVADVARQEAAYRP